MGGLPQVKLPGKAVQAHTTLLALLAVLLCMLPGALGAPSAHYALQTGAVDAPVIPASDVLDVYWRGFQSNGPYAVMPHFLVSVLASGTTCEPSPAFVNASMTTSATLSTAGLVSASQYYVCVLFFDGAAAGAATPTATASSAQFTVDSSPPDVSSAVLDGHAFLNGSVTATWSGVTEDVQAADVEYGWSVGTSAGGSQLKAVEWLGSGVSSVQATGLAVAPGGQVSITLFARNAAGEVSSLVYTSAPLDDSPPSVTSVALWRDATPVLALDTSNSESAATPLQLRWTASDLESGLQQVRLCLTTAPASTTSPACDLIAFEVVDASSSLWNTTLGELHEAVGSGITQRVQFIVEATNGAGMVVVAASPQLLVDPTVPTSGAVAFDDAVTSPLALATGGPLWYYSSTLVVSWSGFADPDSNITHYELATGVGTFSSGAASFTSVGRAQFASVDVEALVAAAAAAGGGDSRVWAAVKAVNGAEAESAPVVATVHVDVTPPSVASVAIALAADTIVTHDHGHPSTIRDATLTLDGRVALSFNVTWSPAIVDDVSGIESVHLSIGTAPGASGEQLLNATLLSTAEVAQRWFVASIDVDAQLEGRPLFASLTVRDYAGLIAATVQPLPGSTFDLSPPVLHLSTAGNVDVYSTLSAAWLATDAATTGSVLVQVALADPHSGVAAVTAEVAFESDGTEVVVGSASNSSLDAFSSTSVTLSVDVSMLQTVLGQRLEVRVQAWNGVGMSTQTSTYVLLTSTEQPFSASPVVVPELRSTAAGLTASYRVPRNSSDEQQVLVDWAVRTEGSTVDDTKATSRAVPRVVSSSEDSDGMVTVEVVDSTVALSHGTSYTVQVTATDEAGVSTTAVSNAVAVDLTPPVAPAINSSVVQVSFVPDAEAATATVHLDWGSSFVDAESGLKACLVSAGTTAGGAQVLAPTLVALTSTSFTSAARPVAANVATALNAAGDVSPNALLPGAAYHGTVTCVNNAGLATQLALEAAVLDVTPPVVLYAHMGTNPDLSAPYLASVKVEGRVVVSWAAEDFETQVVAVSVCMTSVGGSLCDVAPKQALQVEIGSTQASFTGVSVADGTVVTANMWFTNGAGLTTRADTPSALVDTEPPLTGSIEARPFSPALGVFTNYSSSATELSMSWHACADSNAQADGDCWYDVTSRLARFAVAVGSTPGGTDVLPLVRQGLLTTASFDKLELEDGASYWVSVEAEDAAGWFSYGTTSYNITVDVSPAEGTQVLDGPSYVADVDIQTSISELCVTWEAFADNVSSIATTEVAFGTQPMGEQLVPYTVVQSVLERDAAALEELGAEVRADDTPALAHAGDLWRLCKPVALQNGQVYYGSVRVTNGAALVTNVASNGVLVDATKAWSAPPSLTRAELVNVTDPSAPSLLSLQEAGLVGEDTIVSRRTLREQAAVGTGVGAAYNQPIFVTQLKEVIATWEGFVDAETDIVSQRCGLGYLRDSFDIISLDVPADHRTCNISQHEPLIVDGDPFFFVLEGTNAANISARVSVHSPIIKDSSAPLAAGVATLGSDLGSSRCVSALFVQLEWDPFRDFESGVVDYKVCLGTAKGLCEHVPLHSVGYTRNHVFLANATANASTPVVVDGAVVDPYILDLQLGDLVVATVVAVNGAGLESAPLASARSVVVCDGTGVCSDHRERCVDTTETDAVEVATARRLAMVAVGDAVAGLRERQEEWVSRVGAGLVDRAVALRGPRRLRSGIGSNFETFAKWYDTRLQADAIPDAAGRTPNNQLWYTLAWKDCTSMEQSKMNMQQLRDCWRASAYVPVYDNTGAIVAGSSAPAADIEGQISRIGGRTNFAEDDCASNHPQVLQDRRRVPYRGFDLELDELGRVIRGRGIDS